VRTLPDGRSQFVLIFLPGDLFAVKSMFVTRHSDDVVVLSDAVLEHIGQRDLRLAYDEDQDISTRCSWQLVEEERRLHNWVVGLGQGSANERMALLLIDFRGRLILSRSIAPEALSFDMPLSQERLGDHLGISAIHTNRVLKELREKGIVTVRGRKVTIKDYPALCAIAYPLLDTFERNAPEMTGEPAGLPPGERHDGHS
jgi:CRP-like cAMP-binding protein